MARVVFMGTPEFAVPTLRTLAASHEVLVVYTQPDRAVGRGLEIKASPVKTAALELGLSLRQPEKLSQAGEFEFLAALAPDFIVVVAYGQILKKDVLSLPKLGCINIHSSLLPRWRGAAPIQWAILAGDSHTGVTTMEMVEKLDAGDILLQKQTQILPDDTASTVHDRLAVLGAELILPTLQGKIDGTLIAKSQGPHAQVTYASKLTKSMERLDFTEPASVLSARVRALNPWPGTVLSVGKKTLKVRQVRVIENIEGSAGEIFQKAGMVLLGTSRGALELVRVQWEGKKQMDMSEFLNGYGSQLPMRCT